MQIYLRFVYTLLRMLHNHIQLFHLVFITVGKHRFGLKFPKFIKLIIANWKKDLEPLARRPSSQPRPLEYKYYLNDFLLQIENLGEVMFSIGYLSSAGRLTVSVTKARNLRPPEDAKSASTCLET
jgi:hypothetical protein